MFKTIKSKILIITLSMSLVLLFILAAIALCYYHDIKQILIDRTIIFTELQAEELNLDILRTEKNARDLALMGELYYKFDRNPKIAEKTIIEVFENYPISLGGGIWFKPYIVNPDKMRSCIYAYRNDKGKLVLDESFESEEYNYLNQNWYKEIMPNLTRDDNVEWSFPYYEKEGSDSLMITAGTAIYDDDRNIVGLSTVDWDISNVRAKIIKLENKLTKNSFALFANPKKDYIIVTTDPNLNDAELVGKSLKNIPWYNGDLKRTEYLIYNNKKYLPFEQELINGMKFIVCIPESELFAKILKGLMIFSLLIVLISFSLAYFLYSGLRRNVLKPIGALIAIANKIGKGETNIDIKVQSPEEFARLADTFDKMTKDIKTITKERERISSELTIAKSIQTSSLPAIFPPFPERKEFDIFASMVAAKEVGGDFYDFYFIDDNYFMFLIADVSGKGIPAALFMMTTKTIINNVSQIVRDPKDLIEEINKKICSNNKNNLFITMFTGIVDVSTGKLYCINCGHNPPLIKQNNCEFKYMNMDSNHVLGVIEDAKFSIYETKLEPGDVIYTYTDGVTEALNADEEMFGEERLLNTINACGNSDIVNIINSIKSSISRYSGDIPQSDDVTMLAFKYNGVDGISGSDTSNEKTFKAKAVKENYKVFYTWLHGVCAVWKLNEEAVNKIDMCAEEIYANVEFYAYGDETGDIEVTLSKISDEVVELKFKDTGFEYNPLEKADPDITLSPEDRQLGGLGIFMVKQMSESISYERANGQNILTFSIRII